MKVKKTKELLISFILGLIYFLGVIIFILTPPRDKLTMNFFIPSITILIFALGFNFIGYFLNKRNFILISILIYIFCGLFPMFILIIFLIPSILLSFLGYIRMREGGDR